MSKAGRLVCGACQRRLLDPDAKRGTTARERAATAAMKRPGDYSPSDVDAYLGSLNRELPLGTTWVVGGSDASAPAHPVPVWIERDGSHWLVLPCRCGATYQVEERDLAQRRGVALKARQDVWLTRQDR